MKKFLVIIIFTIYYLIFNIATISAKLDLTPTPTDSQANQPKSAKTGALNQQINDLKNRIASRVAQLKLVEKRGIIGTVTDVSDTQITLSDSKGNTRFIDVDELTRFSNPSAKDAFGISDITRGANIGVLGLYNKESRRILARFVDILNLAKIVHGRVLSTEGINYTLKVSAKDNKEISFDVETTTRTLSYSKDGGLTRSGFSKIKEGQRVIVIGGITASKIILLPDIPKNPKITQ